MRSIIFTGGDFINNFLTSWYIKKAHLVIAADGGANSAVDAGVTPDVVIGDLDSIKPKILRKLSKQGVVVKQFPAEKDETDTELAIQHAIKVGATEIVVFGGNMGDRFDHVMANVLLAAITSVPITFVSGNQLSWIKKGPASVALTGSKGDLLSLIPLKGNVEGITLSGLQYPLKNETLYFGKPRGISNVFTRKKAEITFTKGTLLIVQTLLTK